VSSLAPLFRALTRAAKVRIKGRRALPHFQRSESLHRGGEPGVPSAFDVPAVRLEIYSNRGGSAFDLEMDFSGQENVRPSNFAKSYRAFYRLLKCRNFLDQLSHVVERCSLFGHDCIVSFPRKSINLSG